MIELKPYMAGIFKSLDKDWEAEDVQFEATDNGYRITFKNECIADKSIPENDRYKGEWYRNVEITVNLGEKYFTPHSYERWHGVCPCINCCEEERKEKVTDKDKTAPSTKIPPQRPEPLKFT